jgi:hypothetical protein
MDDFTVWLERQLDAAAVRRREPGRRWIARRGCTTRLAEEVRGGRDAIAARHAAGARQRSRLGSGFVLPGAGVAVALLIAVLAVVGLSGGARHNGLSRVPGSARSSGLYSTSLASLESKLAILRRPQTSADRAGNRVALTLLRTRGSALVPRLTRLAWVGPGPGGRIRVYVTVYRATRPSVLAGMMNPIFRRVARGGYVAELLATRGTLIRTSPPVSAASISPGVVPDLVGERGPAEPFHDLNMQLIPDGVQTVIWTWSMAAYGIEDPVARSIQVVAKNNVAIAAAPVREGPLEAALWEFPSYREHRGRRSFTVHTGQDAGGAANTRNAIQAQQLQTIYEVNATAHRPIAKALIEHYALFRTIPPTNLRNWPNLPVPGVSGGYVGEMRLNYFKTRYVPGVSGLDGRGLWITPGLDGICISDPETSSCGRLTGRERSPANGFLGGWTDGTRSSSISGIVPDGNRFVTAILANGKRRTFPVIDNVFEFTVAGRIVAILDRNTSGHVVRFDL